MRSLLNDIRITIKNNFKSIILYELVYRIVFIVLYSKLIKLLMDKLLEISGYSYLTLKNLKVIFSIPFTYPILLSILLAAILFSGFEMSVLYSGFRASASGESIGIGQLIYRGIRRTGRMLRLKNLPIFAAQGVTFYVFEGFILFRLIDSSKRASNIRNVVTDIKALLFLLIIMAAVISILVFIYLFSGCFAMLDNSDRKKALKKGKLFWKGKLTKLIPTYICGTFLYIIAYCIVFAVLMIVISVLVVIFAKDNLEMALIVVISEYIELILLYFFSIIAIVLNCGITVGAYYHFDKERKEKISESILYDEKSWIKRTLMITLLVILVGTIYNIVDVVRNGNLTSESTFGKMQITSHRGYSDEAPENTIPSLELAIESLADYAEIDIRQTKDKEIVLMHDSNVYRTTGVNNYVTYMTYEQIYKLDAGARFKRKYAGTHVPTLREVMELCKGKIKLNIEVKRSKNDVNFIEQLYELIEEMNMEEQCIFSSTDYNYLKQIKGCSQKLRTGYIIPAAYGNYFDDDNIDFFSVNSAFLNLSSVNKAHSYGKGIHAWTINSQIELNRMKRIGIDSVITDKPIYAREVLYGDKMTQSLLSYLKMLLN